MIDYMLVERCKHCGCFLIEGIENEFHEKFCNMNCYKNYCGNRNYKPQNARLAKWEGSGLQNH